MPKYYNPYVDRVFIYMSYSAEIVMRHLSETVQRRFSEEYDRSLSVTTTLNLIYN
jgi:hypothetical protein